MAQDSIRLPTFVGLHGEKKRRAMLSAMEMNPSIAEKISYLLTGTTDETTPEQYMMMLTKHIYAIRKEDGIYHPEETYGTTPTANEPRRHRVKPGLFIGGENEKYWVEFELDSENKLMMTKSTRVRLEVSASDIEEAVNEMKRCAPQNYYSETLEELEDLLLESEDEAYLTNNLEEYLDE